MLATVTGDVHDIGKNLVDIILSNNGYDVVNIGIKQPISAIITAADENGADVIGMSGLLVKSTVVMRDNLVGAQLPRHGPLAGRCCSAGRRSPGPTSSRTLPRCSTARCAMRGDAFEGLRLMDAAMAVKRGEGGRAAARAPDPAGAPPAAVAAGGSEADGPGGGGRRAARPFARWPSWPRFRRPPFLGHAWSSRASRWLQNAAFLERAGPPLPRASGPSSHPVAPGVLYRPGTRGRATARRGCGCGWSGPAPRACWRQPATTATSAASARATIWSCWA